MSLIESALSKVRKSGAPAPQPGSRSPEHGSHRVVLDAVEASQLPPLQIRQTTFDRETMERNNILPEVIDQAALRAYKILRTRILQRMMANDWRSVAITGTASGEGKTLTAINLALALAQDPNTWVFLVDLDLQRPHVAPSLGLSFDKGLGEYLAGDAQINDVFYTAGPERLAILPNARTFENSSELLLSPRMAELATILNRQSPRRIIIYDMPPLLTSDDVLAFAPQVDGMLLVVSEGVTARNSLEKCKELLGETNVIGVVLNQSMERNDSVYY